MNQDKPNTISIKYIFDPNYNPVYINGAYGGISPKGEIIANFFLERMALPYEIFHKVNSNGSLGEAVGCDPDDLERSMVRYVSNGIVLNKKAAYDVIAWLTAMVEQLEKAEQAQTAAKN